MVFLIDEEGIFQGDNSPNGTITSGAVTIKKAEFIPISGSSPQRYYLNLAFQDNNYVNTQNAIGGPQQSYNPFSSTNPSSDVKAQSPFQLPPYIVRILKKRSPFTNSNGYSGYTQYELLWEDLSSFNDQEYIGSTNNVGFPIGQQTITLNGLGVGLTPYYYRYTSAPWNYLNIETVDATDNGLVSVMFDANGGAAYTGGPGYTGALAGTPGYNGNGFQQIFPYKQVCFGTNGPTNPVFKFCESYNGINGFTEPGAYLVVIMRNSIDNSVSITDFLAKNKWDINSGTNSTNPYIASALVIIQPTINLTYEPSVGESNDGRLSFVTNAYGSNMITNSTNETWSIVNPFFGIPNFNTPKYQYSNSTVNSNNPNGLFPTSNTLSFTPNDRFLAVNSLTVSVDRRKLRLIESSPSDFNVSGAFMYDFRLVPSGTYSFCPYSTILTGQWPYINFTLIESSPINSALQPNFYTSWIWKLRNNQNIINPETVFYNGGFVVTSASQNSYTPIIYSNSLSVPSSITIPVPIDVSIMNIGSDTTPKYIFNVTWTEPFESALTNNLIGNFSKYVLRLYKRSTDYQNGSLGSEYINNPQEPYKYNNPTNTGIVVSTDQWKTSPPSSSSYTMDVYMSKNGTLFYNDISGTENYYTSSETYWSADEILGGWLIVLQRNFTQPGSTIPTLITSGCFAISVPNPTVSVITNEYGNVSSLTTSPTNIFMIAKNYWSTASGTNPVTISQITDESLINVPDPSISQLRSIYPYNPSGPGLLNRVEVDFGIALTNNEAKIQESLGSFGTLLINYINGLSGMIYNSSSNIVAVSTLNPPPSPLTLNLSVINFDFGYGNQNYFELNWDEPLSSELTTNIVGAKNVIRIYRYTRNENTTKGDFISGPLDGAKFIDITNTGLNLVFISDFFAQWNPNSPKVYINQYTQTFTYPYGLARGWTNDELKGAWLFILQRNFSSSSTLNLVTQGAYYVNFFGEKPQLSLSYDSNGIPSGLVTNPFGDYTNAINVWEASKIQDNTFQTISTGIDSLTKSGNPSINTIDNYWPASKGPSIIRNSISLDFSVPTTGFVEPYNGLNNLTTDVANITISNGTSLTYSGTTNDVNLYTPEQTNNSGTYVSDETYTYDTFTSSTNSYTYLKVTFNEPNFQILSDNAYTINILKKTQGSGNALSQWVPVSTVFSYQNSDNPGYQVTKTNVTDVENTVSIMVTLNIFANGIVFANNQTYTSTDITSSFDEGSYLIIFRRNFTNNLLEGGTWPLFSVNSGFVNVIPSSLQLEYDNTSDSLSVATPIAGSYNNTGTIDIDFMTYISLGGVEEPIYFIYNAGQSNIQTSSIMTHQINIETLKKNYPDSGPISVYVVVNYNWSSPNNFDLGIGKIGSELGYKNAVSAVSKTSSYITPNLVSTNINRILLPSNNSWTYKQGNIIREVKASFTSVGNNLNEKLLAIRWEEMNPTDLCGNFTGSPYNLRLYKKRQFGDTSNDQWYQPSNGYYGIDSYATVVDGQDSDGVGVNATFLPTSSLPQNAINKKIVYIFADKDGHIWENAPPTKDEREDVSRYHPFIDAITMSVDGSSSINDAGGYVLVIQRNFVIPGETEQFISTTGIYLNLMPSISWSLTDNNGMLVSEPDTAYTTYLPGANRQKDIVYSWNLALPNIGYSNIVPGEISNEFNLAEFKSSFKNRDKSAIITSNVTYNFSVTQMPFMELYPLLYIQGTGTFQASSLPFTVDLCVKPTSFPPPPWTRFSLQCPDVTPEEREKLQMRRKAETLMHVSNKHQRRFTKAQRYSFIAQGYNQKRQTYATQTDSYTNPNTKNYPIMGRAIVLPDQCDERVLTFPSTCSDVPGPVVPLTYDPSVPLVNYVVVRTYNNSQTEYYDEKGE